MQAALIGLPQSGKSTLFAAATSQKPDPGEAPQERRAIVHVPDPRLDFLVELYQPEKATLATIEFVDIPGFSLADARGQQELRKHLPTMRLCDLLVLVVRDFQSDQVPAYRKRVDAAADLAELHEELIFADLDTVSTRIEKLERALKKPTKSHEHEQREMELLAACRQALEDSQPLSTVITRAEDARMLSSFAFLTEKPALVAYNVGDDRAAEAVTGTPPFARCALNLCADMEAQIEELEAEDREVFMADLGVTEPARDKLIRSCCQAMGVITFFTVSNKEVRAWTINQGASALEAAGKVHTDMARGFIRAETVAYEDLRAAGDIKAAKAAGKVRQEGKTYVVQDGDVIYIRFNV